MKEVFTKWITLGFAALVMSFLTIIAHPQTPPFLSQKTLNEVSRKQIESRDSKILWIDTRPIESYHASHIKGALPLPSESFDEYIEEILTQWQPGMRILVYCGGAGCQRSHDIAQILRDEYDLKEVFVLKGGYP